MESLGILRVLWRNRQLLGLGIALAVGVAMLTMYRVSLLPPGLASRETSSGFASQRVLVDTPTSLLADARPRASASILIRSVVLADLLEGSQARTEMARQLGVSPSLIGVVSSATATPYTESPLATEALNVTRPHQPFMVNVGLETSQPILSIFAIAPDRSEATKLAAAATGALDASARDAQLSKGRVRIEELGGAVSGTKQLSAGKRKAVLFAGVIFIAWCLGTVGFDRLRRRRRAAPWRAGQDIRV